MSAGATLSAIADDLIRLQTQVAACAPNPGTYTHGPWTGRAATQFADRVSDALDQLRQTQWAIESAAQAAYRHEALLRTLRAALAGGVA